MKIRSSAKGFIHTDTSALTEADIRAAFFATFSDQFPWIFPNTRLGDWECDVLVLDEQLISTEWEIKISKADFRNDAKKWAADFSGNSAAAKTKFQTIQSGERTNYFGYLAPAGLLSVDDVPDFAGLMVLDPVSKQFTVLKPPPQLHSETFPMENLSGIMRSVYHRFWSFKNRETATDSTLDDLRKERDKLHRRLQSEIQFRENNLHLTDGELRSQLADIITSDTLSAEEKLYLISKIIDSKNSF